MKQEEWEREVPILTASQKRVQNDILFNLGRDRRTKGVGTNNIDSSYSVGAWLRDINIWELDSLAVVDSFDSSDSEDL